jgi:ribose transport system substrate-binding protein
MLLALAASVGVAACGSNSSNSSGDTATAAGEDAAGIQAATQAISPLEQHPSEIPSEEPLKTRPTGKKFVYVQCAVPECAYVGQFTKEAAKALGARLTIIKAGADAESIGQAFDSAIAQKPDVVLENAIDPSLWTSQRKKLAALGIPVVAQTTPVEAGNGISFALIGPEVWTRMGKLMADWVVSKSEGKAKAALFWPPQLPVFKFYADSFKQELSKACPSCDVELVTVPASEIGTPRLSNRVVSYLQANPDVKYVTMGFGSMAIGVPQALAAAGLTKDIQIVSNSGGPTNFQYIKNGQQTMDLAMDLAVQAWIGADAAARLATGQEIAEPDPLPPIQFLTKDNLTFDPSKLFISDPNYKQHFEELWAAAK